MRERREPGAYPRSPGRAPWGEGEGEGGGGGRRTESGGRTPATWRLHENSGRGLIEEEPILRTTQTSSP